MLSGFEGEWGYRCLCSEPPKKKERSLPVKTFPYYEWPFLRCYYTDNEANIANTSGIKAQGRNVVGLTRYDPEIILTQYRAEIIKPLKTAYMASVFVENRGCASATIVRQRFYLSFFLFSSISPVVSLEVQYSPDILETLKPSKLSNTEP